MFKKVAFAATVLCSMSAFAETQITGNVAPKCVVTTDTVGVYGNPIPQKLSTASADGGVEPIVRFDVVQADYYNAKITAPNSFSESPTLNDTVAWTHNVSVSSVSDAGMSAYDTSKIEYDNVTEVPLSIAGSTWFKISSTATYGYEKAFPAGNYRTIVEAECIAK
jgi:Trk-type K+ transport system membrane component